MAYDRYDTRDMPRDERSRWSEDRNSDRGRRPGGEWRGERSAGGRDDRGFFERAGDEVASWFGDDEAERRRREDRMRDEREGGYGPRLDTSSRDRGFDRDRNWNDNRGPFAGGGSSDSDYNRGWRREPFGAGDRDQDRFRDRGRDYRPMTGDYSRARSDSEWDLDPYRSTSRAGTSDWSDRSRHEDPNYRSWRDRHLSELDRDYDDYRREHQSKFESDFGSWRERRQQKRSLLGQIREHMEVVGNDDEHVGTVDRIAGDRIILTKSDPESGGAHHSLSCSELDRIEGDKVILDCSAEEARKRWRDERRSRALFERDDQGEVGPRTLDRSFEGTYR
ncbi:DUF2171 domain-containing protein [Sphingomonas sp.]|uniref:DUF2171 domain-containing protein n=1 Tax=Sphingomonas sp. TaxID=28214 RepID=UPI0038A544E8